MCHYASHHYASLPVVSAHIAMAWSCACPSVLYQIGQVGTVYDLHSDSFVAQAGDTVDVVDNQLVRTYGKLTASLVRQAQRIYEKADLPEITHSEWEDALGMAQGLYVLVRPTRSGFLKAHAIGITGAEDTDSAAADPNTPLVIFAVGRLQERQFAGDGA